MCEIVQYTAIFGGYDQIPIPSVASDGVRYVLYTDRETVRPPWEVRVVKLLDNNPRRTQRYYKILAHRWFPDAVTIWHGGNIQTRSDPLGMLKWFGGHIIAAFQHPWRRCIYQEAKMCIQMGKGNRKTIQQQMKHYRDIEHYPSSHGLFACWFLLRKPNKRVARFNEAWWKEVERWSARDQLSFPYTLWKSKLKCGIVPGNLLTSPDFHYYEHST